MSKRLCVKLRFLLEPGDIVFSGPVKPAPPTINETFVSYNNIPMGATHHKGRVFISVPRRRPGIPATLNVIDIEKQKKGNKSPALTAYPENRINQLHVSAPSFYSEKKK